MFEMFEILTILLLGSLIYWVISRASRTQVRRLAKEIHLLRGELNDFSRVTDERLSRLELPERAAAIARPEAVPPVEAALAPVPAVAEAVVIPLAVEVEVPVAALEAQPVAEREARPAIPAVEPAAAARTSDRWARAQAVSAERRSGLERMLLENWTGILGAVVVVAGVTFVGIYTALRLEPFYRFLMMLAAAGVLLGGATALARNEAWQTFAVWLRTAGAAILLFACAASGTLPNLGLQWIEAPLPALALTLAGIAVNLYFAYSSSAQTFATLHVLLSLLPLAIVPATPVSLVIATAVAVAGLGIGVRACWDVHVAAVVGAFALFDFLWYVRMGAGMDAAAIQVLAAACSALVFGGTACSHHVRGRGSEAALPLLTALHLGAWALLTVALFIYVPEPVPRGGVLVALAVLSYGLGLSARGRGIAWLYQADTLSSQGFVLLALVSLHQLHVGLPLIALVALLEMIAFRAMVPRGADVLLDWIADALPPLAGLILAAVSLADVWLRPESRLGTVVVALAGAITVLLGQRALTVGKQAPPLPHREIGLDDLALRAREIAWQSGLLVVCALVALWDRPWLEPVGFGAGTALFVLLRVRPIPGVVPAALIALIGAHLVSWSDIASHLGDPAQALSLRIVPLTALAVATVVLAGPGVLRPLAVALLGVDFGIAAYAYLDPVSSLAPGVVWLLLSLVALEVANRVPRREAATTLSLGYAYLALFAAAYALVIVQSPAYVGMFSARVLIEAFALGVFAYWWFYPPHEVLARQGLWTVLHPYFVELLVVALSICVVVELPAQWWSIAWVLIALAMLSPAVTRLFDARVRFYSLVLYWVSIADMAISLSVMEVPSPAWYDRPEVTSLAAMVLQVVYVVRAHRLLRVEKPAEIRLWQLPSHLLYLITAYRNRYVYYPLFAGVALFLYWRFAHSLLTLLWSAEAFVVFVLSAWLRENQFRIVALVGLGACLARLVLVDMAESNLALRGVVFIGVGLLMLGMNAIYNRYHARFET